MERILYVCASNPGDVGAWSGSTYHIFHALQRVFSHVDPFVVAGAPTPLAEKIYGSVQHRLFHKHSYYELRHGVTRRYAKEIGARLLSRSYDAVFAPGTIYFADLAADLPAFATADACLGGLVDYYDEFTNLTRRDLNQGFEIERKAARACRKVFYTSDWARRTAIETAGVSEERAVVVPFGANLLDLPNVQDIESFVARRPDDRARLLFVGVDWIRKGGGIAFDAAKLMNEQGTTTELHIVGGNVPADVASAPFVTYHGFLKKSNQVDLAKLVNLLAESHFLMLPTRAECCAVVFAEASSYGLPILATNTGGVETAVRNGINGFTFEFHACANRYASKALELLSRPDDYRNLCFSAHGLAKRVLNWDVCAETWKREMLAES